MEIRWNNNETFLLGGVYRSPQSSNENNLIFLDKTKDKHYSNVMIISDFNLPEINWNLWTTCKS